MTYHSVTAAEIWHNDGKLRQLRQLQHLQLSCNYPVPPADRRKTEDALITGGERETSLEELNKLTNPVWNPVTSSSSAQNMNYSILMTRALHGGESTQAWIRRESVNIRRGPWSGYHCWYHHCRPPVACRLECMKERLGPLEINETPKSSYCHWRWIYQPLFRWATICKSVYDCICWCVRFHNSLAGLHKFCSYSTYYFKTRFCVSANSHLWINTTHKKHQCGTN